MLSFVLASRWQQALLFLLPFDLTPTIRSVTQSRGKREKIAGNSAGGVATEGIKVKDGGQITLISFSYVSKVLRVVRHVVQVNVITRGFGVRGANKSRACLVSRLSLVSGHPWCRSSS